MQLSKSNYIINNKLHSEINELKNQIDLLNMQSTKTKNKIGILIQLIRKYANKFLALSQMISSKDNITCNSLINTINQFHNMIYNPKLNESLFDLNELVIQDNTDYIKEFSDLIQKYEDKIKIITEENNNIKSKISKITNDYNLKVSNIEKEKEEYAKQLKTKNEQIDLLNNKLSSLEDNLKTKQNRIEELEALMNKPNQIDREIVFTGNNNKNEEDIAQYLNKSDIMEDSHINIGDINDSNLHMSTSRPKQIKKEIADLDVEITELRNQLKSMLKK